MKRAGVPSGETANSDEWVSFEEALARVTVKTGLADPAPAMMAAIDRGAIRAKGKCYLPYATRANNGAKLNLNPRAPNPGFLDDNGRLQLSVPHWRWVSGADTDAWIDGLLGKAMAQPKTRGATRMVNSHAAKQGIYHTGAAGHPTSMSLILFEAKHRLEHGERLPDTQRAFAEELSAWLRQNHEQAPPARAKTIQNNADFRELWRNHRIPK